jgi:hypothetical protein
LPEEIIRLKAERMRLIGAEREAIDVISDLANSRGNLLERFSIGTYNTLEALGLELERLFTGNTTPRPPLPKPDSVRRLEESDPAGPLAEAHRERLLVEGRLREELAAAGFIIDVKQVEEIGQGAGKRDRTAQALRR